MRLVPLLALLLAASAASAQTGVCANGSATLDGVTYECDGIDVLANIPATDLFTPTPTCTNRSGQTIVCDGYLSDIWGWADPDDGKEYALIGTRTGAVFVDVSTPGAPRVLGQLEVPNNDPNRIWRDIKVYKDHAFVGGEVSSHGIQIFDLTRLRGLSEDVSRTFQADAVYAGVGSSHNVVINEETGFLYAVGMRSTGAALPASCAARGFHAVDISTPTSPTFAGCFSDVASETGPRIPGYTHDAQCVVYAGPDTDHQGKELCFAANEDVVSVFDVSNKSAVTLIAQIAYPNESYTHQGWLTEDHRYFVANDELDEANGLVSSQRTLVFDVSDLDNPDFSFQYDSGLSTIDHNNYTLGTFAYQANYEAGLRILDLRQIDSGSLSEIAFFDTYPQSTTVDFDGLWSVYPYLPSGTLIASDINNGLFVLRPQAQVLSEGDAPIEDAYALSAPQPNPTTARATLTLQVRDTQAVSARLYDLTGRELATLYTGSLTAQRALPLTVDTGALPTGVYVIRVEGETFAASERLTVVR